MFRSIFCMLAVFSINAMVFSPSAFACGVTTDCHIGERTYRVRLPKGHDGASKVGAIIFNHGYRGTANGVMKNKGLGKAISDLGLALIAPKSLGADWDIANSPSKGKNTEIAFFDALKRQLVDQHHIDGDKIIVSGFSAGGMMTWNLACERGHDYAGFVPVSGTFWAPVPKSCEAMPTNIIHIHGTSDPVVPMEGRAIADTRQGDVKKALKLATAKGVFGKWNSQGEFDGITCQERASEEGNILQLCVHPGGHSIRSKWLVHAYKVFKENGILGK